MGIRSALAYALLIISFCSTISPTFGKGLVKNGFYKLENLLDQSVLTATFNGNPREVITDEWKESALQDWRVRPTDQYGMIHYILRNEVVTGSEVNKEKLAGEAEAVPIKWILLPVEGKEATFLIQNQQGNCLTNTGFGLRVSTQLCDFSPLNQQWHFVYRFDKYE